MLTFFCTLFLLSGWIGFFILPYEKVPNEIDDSCDFGGLYLICGLTIIVSIFVFLAPETVKLKYLLITSWPICLIYIFYIIEKIDSIVNKEKREKEEKDALERELEIRIRRRIY